MTLGGEELIGELVVVHFIPILQCHFTFTGSVMWLPLCQWSNPEVTSLSLGQSCDCPYASEAILRSLHFHWVSHVIAPMPVKQSWGHFTFTGSVMRLPLCQWSNPEVTSLSLGQSCDCPYASEAILRSLHFHWVSHVIAPMPVKQSWRICVNIYHKPIKDWNPK